MIVKKKRYVLLCSTTEGGYTLLLCCYITVIVNAFAMKKILYTKVSKNFCHTERIDHICFYLLDVPKI
jgi:hypothetical protein